jgi:hypothetical protein
MSYARFSTNGFRSHVYVYKHVFGHYQIDVARKEHDVDRSGLPPEPEPGEEGFAEKYAEYKREVIGLVKGAEMAPIGGPLDGECFEEETAESAVERLAQIREAGYNVPEKAIERLREEAQK